MTREPTATSIEHVGRRAATYYMLQHMHNSTKVHIPETAFLDDEGVMVDWYFVSQTEQVVLKKKKVQQTNIMLFELRLQELAATRRATEVAVQWDDDETVLGEADLDAAVRTLCMREANMTAVNPNLSVPRKHGNGRFCLQEYVAPRGHVRYITHYTKSEHAKPVIAVSVANYKASLDHSTTVAREQCSPEIESILRQCVVNVVGHCRTVRGVLVDNVTLEWVFTLHHGREAPVLISAEYVVAHEHVTEDPRVEPLVKLQRNLEDLRLPTKKEQHGEPNIAPRQVCRHCQRPRELELGKELVKVQTTLRQALANLQHTQEMLEQSRTEGAALKQKDLDVTVYELHNQLKREGAATKGTIQSLQQQLEAQANQLFDARECVRQAARAKDEMAMQLDEAKKQVDEANATAESKLAAMRDEIKELQHELGEKQTRIDQANLDSLSHQHRLDEAQRFREFVFARLADVTKPGVNPPKRCAGGFEAYPCPTPPNVAAVVRPRLVLGMMMMPPRILAGEATRGQPHQSHEGACQAKTPTKGSVNVVLDVPSCGVIFLQEMNIFMCMMC
ncbi:Aste57867_21608 [Aphanomyces stellatus]|uniref:Aste57867_21608 protein n=1 Tax=Aphanomyces stellatus TaxID=120398 RepID=A0A485LMT0_9STRA|nr:hypothetical protein As57867_021539 [Aphanomyces stellatus]VFT98278.1 Aste57867_21608 [Aphanomyces stellatus]